MEHWQRHERDIQDLLGLDSTPASGSQFNAPGDAVDHRHPTNTCFPLLADCKCTEKLSYSLNRKFLLDQTEQAAEIGRRFIMPVRFQHEHQHEDYVVIGLDDFAELMDLAFNRVRA